MKCRPRKSHEGIAGPDKWCLAKKARGLDQDSPSNAHAFHPLTGGRLDARLPGRLPQPRRRPGVCEVLARVSGRSQSIRSAMAVTRGRADRCAPDSEPATRPRRHKSEYLEHFHHERNHQGKGNALLFNMSAAGEPAPRNPIRCRERLGGLLKYYGRICLYALALRSGLP